MFEPKAKNIIQKALLKYYSNYVEPLEREYDKLEENYVILSRAFLEKHDLKEEEKKTFKANIRLKKRIEELKNENSQLKKDLNKAIADKEFERERSRAISQKYRKKGL